ncbi:MAG: hypothetical protein KA143_03090 [Saprospiraceae bacterium]|nr:hypothetical protein [Saprospiraceae bacterium]
MRKIILMLLVLLTLQVTSQTPKSIFDCIYSASGIPTIKLEANWNKVINQKMSEDYFPAKIEMPCGDKTISYDVRIRARGNMRKQVCYFPPIKIDFKNGDLEKAKLDTAIDKLKVVFQCKEGNVNNELLMREKLGYEIYKVINPDYFILHKQVKFECIQEGKLKYTLNALIIEDEGEIADRVKAKIIESGRVMTSALDKDTYMRMVFFQYLIGNTDWSIPNKHNIEMIKVPAVAKVIPIAYDFDYAALVGAPYAIPHESLPIKSIEERYFMGHGVTESDALSTAKYFVEKKEAIYKTVDDCDGLEAKAKSSIKRFFDGAYSMFENEKLTKKSFVQE